MYHHIDVNDLSSFIIKRAKDFAKQLSRYPFDQFDDSFYELDFLEENLIRYIREHIEEY